MSEPLTRARIVALNEKGKELGLSLDFDFNPEKLTLKVAHGVKKSRKARKRHRYSGSSTKSLSFEAVFDNTRRVLAPATTEGGTSGAERRSTDKPKPESLDVRARTRIFTELLDVRKKTRKSKPAASSSDPSGDKGGKGSKPAAPPTCWAPPPWTARKTCSRWRRLARSMSC